MIRTITVKEMGSGASAASQTASAEIPSSSLANYYENASFIRALHREFQQTIDDVAHLGYPPPLPPTTRKLDIFCITESEIMDLEARKMPLSILSKQYEDLAWYLTQNAQSDIDRIQSVFRWITSLDLPLILNAVETLPDPGTPLDYLLKMNWQMGNHAHFFEKVTRAVGMPCVLVNGINKSSAYQPGRPIDRSALRAQWNAVYVDGQWRLIDVFWASTCIVGRVSPDWKLLSVDGIPKDFPDCIETDPGKMIHQVNEFFFLTDPDQFIFTHFPDDPQWQLLPNAFTFEQFESSVYIRERFFQLEMEIVVEELKHSVLFTENGGVLVSFKLPEGRSKNFEFRYILFKSRQAVIDGENLESSIPLDLYVFYEKRKDLVVFDARFPAVGTYKLDLFGRDRLVHETFDLICSYCIECAELREEAKPFPDSPEIGWGPGTVMEEAGLIAESHKAARIETLDGHLEFCFAVDEGIEAVYHSLLNNSFDTHSLSQYAVLRVENNCQLIIRVLLPQPGEYALELFAALKKDNREQLVHNVCNYLIHCLDVTFSAEPFPKLLEGVIGAGPVTETISRVHPLTHEQGFVSDEINTMVLKVQETTNRTATRKRSTDPKTLKSLELALKKAIQMQDDTRIQDLISTMKKDNCPCAILDKANQALQYITTLKDLTEAMRKRKLPNLNHAILAAEKSQLCRRLKIALQMAHRIRDQLRRLDRLRHAILDMDSRTIAEIKSYHKPPLAVFCVLAATYQLLGEEDKNIKDWKSVQFLLSKTGSDQLKKRVADFDIEPLTLDLVGKIRKSLQSLCLESVQAASAGAATFFVWNMGVIQEVEKRQWQSRGS